MDLTRREGVTVGRRRDDMGQSPSVTCMEHASVFAGSGQPTAPLLHVQDGSAGSLIATLPARRPRPIARRPPALPGVSLQSTLGCCHSWAELRHRSRQTSRARTGPSQAALRERHSNSFHRLRRHNHTPGCSPASPPRPFQFPRARRHAAPDGVLSNARRRHVLPPPPPACPLSALARRPRPQQETLSASRIDPAPRTPNPGPAAGYVHIVVPSTIPPVASHVGCLVPGRLSNCEGNSTAPSP